MRIAGWQCVAIQRFVAVNVRDRDFGGGDQPEVVALALEEILFEFGELPGAEEAGGIHHEGRQNFGIAVLTRMHVEHEIGERAPVWRPCPNRSEADATLLGGEP
jgi:hypothetical protein